MSDIQDQVMQANGIDRNKVPDRQFQGIQDLIRRERRWFLLTKLLTGFFWIASLIILGCYMVTVKACIYQVQDAIDDQAGTEFLPTIVALETVLPGVIIIATVCSVFLYIRAKSVNLLQVHERLANLEEMVKILLTR